MRLRTVAGFAALLLALTAGPGHAAPFRIADPAGDGAVKSSSLDIVWVEFRTTGTGSGARYVPWDLMVTMRLNNVPLTTAGVRYVVEADVENCGQLQVTYAPPHNAVIVILPAAQGRAGCDPATTTLSDLRFEVQGASLKWRVPLSSMPLGTGLRAKYTNFRAYAEPGDMFFGGTGSLAGSEIAADVAKSSDTWVVR